MIKVNELFSGIGAFRKALINLNIPHQIIGISEIDKYAIRSYEAMYGETRNYGDISKVQKLDYADLWTYGFPCQDISVAGFQQGIIPGETRSGLLYEVQRLLWVAKENGELPKYLILENVKNLVGKKFKAQFLDWLQWLDELGYNSYWDVINARNCGVPHQRERESLPFPSVKMLITGPLRCLSRYLSRKNYQIAWKVVLLIERYLSLSFVGMPVSMVVSPTYAAVTLVKVSGKLCLRGIPL